MSQKKPEITEDELKAAYNRAKLYRCNISFVEALDNSALNMCLHNMAKVYRKVHPSLKNWQFT